MARSLPALLAALALACADSAPMDGSALALEGPTAATEGATLGEHVGIETVAGEFTPILEKGCALPCEETATFGTFEEEQMEIWLFLFRGEGTKTADAHELGVVEISGFPDAAAGEVEVIVTFRASSEGLVLSAREKSGLPVELRHERVGAAP